MLDVRYSAQFKRDFKLCVKRGCDMKLLQSVIDMLRVPAALPAKNRSGYQECHILPDWLLVYRVSGSELQLARTGTHSDLFGK